MSIRQKILDEARRQFNERGLAKTSAKTIAASLEISDGNLRYHFKTKEDLVLGLYQELVARFDALFGQAAQGTPGMQDYWDMLVYVFRQLDEFAFLMLDFAAVMREYPQIRDHYRQLQKGRLAQFHHLKTAWQAQGWLRQDLDDVQYEHLYVLLNTFSDFWVPRAYIIYEGPATERLLAHCKQAFAMLVPYFTPPGLAEWRQVKQELSDGH